MSNSSQGRLFNFLCAVELKEHFHAHPHRLHDHKAYYLVALLCILWLYNSFYISTTYSLWRHYVTGINFQL